MRHLKIYRAIHLITREGSIRRAAEALAISPSALNRSIQAFEEEMGVSVFERIPSGVRPSVAGELLLDMIDRHLTEFDEMQIQLNDLRDGLSGTLRVSLGSDLGAGLVPAALATFEQEFPGVSVVSVTDDTTDGLHRRDVDLGILTNPTTDDAVEVLYSQAVPLAAWRSPQDATPAAKIGLWDIVDARLFLPPDGTGTRAAISHLLRRHRLGEGVTTTLTAAEVSQHMIGGPAVCIYPEITLNHDEFGPVLERLPLSLGQVQFTAMRSNRVPLTRSAQAFLTILQHRLHEATPHDDG